MNSTTNTPIVDGLIQMLSSPLGGNPQGSRIMIEVAQGLEIESNNRHREEVEALKQESLQKVEALKQQSLQDMRMLAINIENKDREISNFTDKKIALELILAAQDKELTVLRKDIKVYRSTNAIVSEENKILRETVAAQEKELKRLREDMKVCRSIEAFQQQLAGEDSSAAKHTRADSPDGSGAQA
jgi:hypothetical protein